VREKNDDVEKKLHGHNLVTGQRYRHHLHGPRL